LGFHRLDLIGIQLHRLVEGLVDDLEVERGVGSVLVGAQIHRDLLGSVPVGGAKVSYRRNHLAVSPSIAARGAACKDRAQRCEARNIDGRSHIELVPQLIVSPRRAEQQCTAGNPEILVVRDQPAARALTEPRKIG
jgi:hypothetical protein